MSEFKSIPYRIRIGVTGHRTLTDPDFLKAQVKLALKTEVPSLFPAKSRSIIDRVLSAGITSISYSVLSPLAEGADRLVASAVLSEPHARLDAVLPLALDDYLEDFSAEESRAEFQELLAQSRNPVRLRTRRICDDRNDPDGQAELRRESYANVGQYVVDHCDVLVALWDGEPSRGRGGTAEIVQYAREQSRPVIRVWQDTFEVLNSEANNGLDATALEAIDRFNRQPVRLEQRNAYIGNLDQDFFVKPKTAGDIPAAVRELANSLLFPYYSQASVVAKRSQNLFYRAGKYIYLFSAAAVGCASIGVLLPQLSGLCFSVELMLLTVIFFTFQVAKRKHAHSSWIENRFLAERIRCGIFMAICGVEPRPIEVLPYMGHSQTVNDWTVRVFDEVWSRLPPLSGCTEGECLIFNSYVREVWIGDQVKFHLGKEKREGHRREGLAKAGEIILPATIAAAALHLLMPLWHPAETASEYVHVLHAVLHHGLSFVALLFPAVAASLAGMEAHREHLRLERRSANMVPQLKHLNKQMVSATAPERFQSLLLQVDEMMLRETQDWLMLMRYVEIKAG